MKFESVSDLFFVVAVLVPGFLWDAVLRNFVPLRDSSGREQLLLRYLTWTAFNYAICSPLIYLLISAAMFAIHPLRQAIAWLAITLLAPTLLGMAHAYALQTRIFAHFFYRVGLQSVNPIPTGWDWIFSRPQRWFVLITMTDGSQIGGYFGPNSLASSDPGHRDLYLEKVYRIPEEGDGAWEPVVPNLGIWVDGAQIAFIRYRGES